MNQEYNLIQIKKNLEVILKELHNKKLILDKSGLYDPSKFKSLTTHEFTDHSITNIAACIEEIKEIYKPYITKFYIYSYGGKHCIERFRRCQLLKEGDVYISNGEFIAAMLLLNIKYIKSSLYDHNCEFLGKLNY
jgi:hypothetical protein